MKQGFGIVEAMVVVTIIGILVALGYSRFNYHVAKTRQAEAKNILEHLVILQESYFMEHGKYSWMKSIGLKRKGDDGYGPHACHTDKPGEEMRNELGFRPSNCESLRYEYWMPRKCDSGPHPPGRCYPEPAKPIEGSSASYIIRADNIPNRSGVYIWPGCEERDEWRVQKDSNVHQANNNRKVLEVCE